MSMSKPLKGLILAIVLTSSISGCVMVPKGEEVEVLYVGSINASNGSFQMDGFVSTGGGIPDRGTYRDVSIQLYTEDGTVLCGTEVGDLEASHSRRNVSVTASVVPEYVILTSPDFWNEDVKVDYFQQDSNMEDYDRNYVGSKSELPISIAQSDGEPCSA